jgi:hypothetical protein
MKTGIREAIRRFVERNLIADDPQPGRSWLDEQDMPLPQPPSTVPVPGLAMDPLPLLPGRHFGHRRSHPFNRLRGRHKLPAHHADGAPSGRAFQGRWPS